jgi:hypothetical protein
MFALRYKISSIKIANSECVKVPRQYLKCTLTFLLPHMFTHSIFANLSFCKLDCSSSLDLLLWLYRMSSSSAPANESTSSKCERDVAWKPALKRALSMRFSKSFKGYLPFTGISFMLNFCARDVAWKAHPTFAKLSSRIILPKGGCLKARRDFRLWKPMPWLWFFRTFSSPFGTSGFKGRERFSSHQNVPFSRES